MATPAQPADSKQYFVLKQVKLSAFQILRPNTVVFLDPEIATPLIAAGLLCPVLFAIKQGLYPPKPEENFIEAAVKEVKTAIKETKTEIASSLSQLNVKPGQSSPLVQQLKDTTKQRNTRSVAFENELKKKIQERKKTAKNST